MSAEVQGSGSEGADPVIPNTEAEARAAGEAVEAAEVRRGLASGSECIWRVKPATQHAATAAEAFLPVIHLLAWPAAGVRKLLLRHAMWYPASVAHVDAWQLLQRLQLVVSPTLVHLSSNPLNTMLPLPVSLCPPEAA